MSLRALPLVLAAVVLVGCGSSVAPGGAGIVTADGRIGALRIDVSTAADVVRFAGKADVTVTGRTSWPGVPSYHALGYDCTNRRTRRNDPAAALSMHLSCRTAYFLNVRTHRLAAFWTESPSFRTVRGTSPGMKQSEANRREHATPGGPWFAMGKSLLLIMSTCKSESPGHCLGETVGALALESRRHPIGLLFT